MQFSTSEDLVFHFLQAAINSFVNVGIYNVAGLRKLWLHNILDYVIFIPKLFHFHIYIFWEVKLSHALMQNWSYLILVVWNIKNVTNAKFVWRYVLGSEYLTACLICKRTVLKISFISTHISNAATCQDERSIIIQTFGATPWLLNKLIRTIQAMPKSNAKVILHTS